jgi:hypothetical protein
MVPEGGVKIRSDKHIAIGRAHKTSAIAKDARKPMDDLNYGTEEVDQFAILSPIVVELFLSLKKSSDDVVGGMTVLELLCGGMVGKVYSGLLGIVVQRGI